jgi:hypothetical protein
MLATLVQVVLLAAPRAASGRAAAPACPEPDVATSTLTSGYLPAQDDTTFARCSDDPDYLFSNESTDVTKSFLIEANVLLRDRAGFESAVHQLAVAVNGLWAGKLDRRGAMILGPCGDDFYRFLYDRPVRPGEEHRVGTAAAGGLTVLGLLRLLGFEDEGIWGPQDARLPAVRALISKVLDDAAVDGGKVGTGDDELLDLLRVGNVVELGSGEEPDWLMVASRPQAVTDKGERSWRFMAVIGGASVESVGAPRATVARLVRTTRMRARFVQGRWHLAQVSPCDRDGAPDRPLARYYDTWEVFRAQAHPYPPRLPMGALLPDLPMSGEWSPWPDMFQKAAGVAGRQVRPGGTRR